MAGKMAHAAPIARPQPSLLTAPWRVGSSCFLTTVISNFAVLVAGDHGGIEVV